MINKEIEINGKLIFWLSGVLIGVFSGPNQSASRSLMGRLTPSDKKNELFIKIESIYNIIPDCRVLKNIPMYICFNL